MTNLNLNKPEWLELVFEGKNKTYGAYQLRKNNQKTTIKAFVSAIATLTAIASLPLLLVSFNDKPKLQNTKTLQTKLVFTAIKLPKKQIVTQPISSQQLTQKSINKSLRNPKIVKPQAATNPIVTGNNTNTTNNTTGNTNSIGNTNLPTLVPTIPVVVITEKIPEIFTEPMLEEMPLFPGGIEAFLNKIATRFVTPELEEQKMIRILVYFVVEADGTLSNIKVPQKSDYNLDTEAVRVLNSIKTKWKPGIYKGKPVRTAYTLPIVIKTL